MWNYAGRSTKSSPLGKKAWQQVIIPKSLRRMFLQLVHDAPVSGHLGRDRTLERARQTEYWPSVVNDVSNYCMGCPKCQLRKRPKHTPRAPMQATEIPAMPLSKICCDFVGPYPATPDGYKYVLQIQDILSRYVKFIPTKNQKPSNVRGKLRNHYQGPYVVVGQTGPVTYRIRQAANAGAKQEVRHYNQLLPWRRQKLQHEMQREVEEEDVELHDKQPVVNPRRSTRARQQTQFIQFENDRQSYQY